MKQFTILAMALLMAATVSAQEVDKAKVQSQASAAQSAGADLKKVDTGDKDWKFSGAVGLNAAATGLWNWAPGGNSNVNGVAYSRMRLLYHKNNIAWDSNLDMEYGLSWIDQDYDKFQKSSDKLNFSTKFGWEFKEKWYLTALGSMNTQFAYGRNYNGNAMPDAVTSKFMAPGYFDVSVGIDWKPNDIFSVYLSPIAGRFTVVSVSSKTNERYVKQMADKSVENIEEIAEALGYSGDLKDEALIRKAAEAYWGASTLENQLKESYGVWKYTVADEATGKMEKSLKSNCRAELGLSFKGAVNYKYKDLSVSTTLGLYTPYQWKKNEIWLGTDGAYYRAQDGVDYESLGYSYVGWEDNNRRFGNFDVDWVVNLGYQFFNCLQVTLSTDLRYYNGVKIADKEGNAAERVQFKGVIGLGIGYSF